MASIVYILCTFASSMCCLLLLKGYRASKSRLLFWCFLGFAGLTLNNLYLFLDLAIFVEIELVSFRPLPGLIGLTIMLYGLIMEEV